MDERVAAGSTVGLTVGQLSDCRTVGLSELSDYCSDYCRTTVGLYCRTVGPGLRAGIRGRNTHKGTTPPKYEYTVKVEVDKD